MNTCTPQRLYLKICKCFCPDAGLDLMDETGFGEYTDPTFTLEPYVARKWEVAFSF